jgi:serine/threonine protein kinase
MNGPRGLAGSEEDNPVLTDLVEAFAARVQAGEAVDAEAYARAHPPYEATLRRLLPAVLAMTDLGDSNDAQRGGVPATASPSVPLERLGDFQLLQEVGRGGMGVVYQAEQVSLGRRVALKVLPCAAALDGRQLQRFKNEAQAAALLQHPNIVPVIAVGCDRGTHFFAMQFIDGTSLAALIRDLRSRIRVQDDTRPDASAADPDRTTDFPNQPEDRATTCASGSGSDFGEALLGGDPPARSRSYFRAVARLGLQAAEALEHAHQLGVIHRDVKPANLLVDGRGNLWVTDFGLARLQHDAGVTASGDLVGTIRYMSPEQAQARRLPVDHRTDVYGLGATLYELVTLQQAFPGDDRRELLRRIVLEDPRRPRRVNPAIPADLEAIVLKAMEKAPPDRYPSAHELAEDLKRFLADEPVRARRPALWRSATKWVRRHAGVVGTAAVAAVALAATLSVAVTLLTVSNTQLRDQEQLLRTKEAALTDALRVAREKTASLTREQGEKAAALEQAQQNAKRAKLTGGLLRQALLEVLVALPDEKLNRDPQWAGKAKELLDKGLQAYEFLAGIQGADVTERIELAWGFRKVGYVFARLGQYDQARKVYERTITLGEQLVKDVPGNQAEHWSCRFLLAGTYRELGDLHRNLGHRNEALTAYQDSLGVWSRPSEVAACPLESSLAHEGLGNICEVAGRMREAAEHFREAIRRRQAYANFPDHQLYLVHWHRKLGGLLCNLAKPDEAAGHTRTAYEMAEGLVRQSNHHPTAVKELVYCCFARGGLVEETDPQAAARFYRQGEGLLARLVEDTPGEPLYRHYLALAHERLGALDTATQRPSEATEHFRKAHDLLYALARTVPGGGPGPGAPGSNENAFAVFLTHCPDEHFRDSRLALEYANKAVARAPRRGDYLGTLGAAYYRIGKPGEAVTALEKAVELPEGGTGVDWFFLALAHEKQGNHERARECHRKALQWAQRHRPHILEFRRLRDEATAQLGDKVASPW